MFIIYNCPYGDLKPSFRYLAVNQWNYAKDNENTNMC
jgi:hypothetical protein